MNTVQCGRRQFLRKSAKAVLGAVAVPAIMPGSVFGINGTVAPSNRIVMGFIGVGGQGTRGMAGGIWAPEGGFIGRKEVQGVAVCDVNANNRNNARAIINRKNGNDDCAVYGDFRELLARKDIDAVLIATGDRWHPLISMAAAKAGKDIYSEKPMSVTIQEAKTLRETINRYGVVYQLGTQQRSSYSFRFACELVRNGHIGDVKEVIVAVGGTPGIRVPALPAEPVPDYLDYDMWLGPIPWRPYNSQFVGGWMAFRDCSGGEMTNWGAHHFDIAQWGLGMDDSGPVEIIPPDAKEIKTITYRYANGAVMTRDPERMRQICGQDNGVVFIGTKGQVAVWRYEVRTWPEGLIRHKTGSGEIHLHECDNHHTDFLNSVRNRTKPGSNVNIGCRSITTAHLGNIAYELGRPLKWNPVREEFENDDEANRMQFRQMRSPWHL
jgi:predicted dehydrogenase